MSQGIIPSVKGTVISSAVADVLSLIAVSRIRDTDREKYLISEDEELLESIITPVGWYSMASFGRLMELLAHIEAGGSSQDYFVERGTRAAERLLGSTYHHFDAEPGTWGRRVGETLMNLGQLVYNFTEWTFHEPEPGNYEVRVECSEGFHDPARYTSQGFLDYFASRASGKTIKTRSDCMPNGSIVYRFTDQP